MVDTRYHYDKARKIGLKTINTYKANGWNTHVPSLDSIISREGILSEVSLGVVDIPTKKIKGTKTNARRSSFSPDFMPILDVKTEFAMKWMHLYKAHIEEGLRDPIKVYEYLNWYYVEEGNKRVSILRYNEAILYKAHVTRLIPKYDKDDPVIVTYYEFMDFYKKTGINYMWFNEPGSFAKMLSYIDRYRWQDKENEGILSQTYYRFRRLYRKLGGNKLPITTGDAFLKYLDIYPYKEEEDAMIEENLNNLWHEFEVLGEVDGIELELAPKEAERKSIFSGWGNLAMAKKPLNIAFIHAKNKEDSAWTYAHEIGRMHLENNLGDMVKTSAFNNIPEDEKATAHIQKVAEQGFDVVIATSPAFIYSTLKVSMNNEHIKFLNCSENMSYRHLRTYFGRIFEPNFLVGMIAGAMTKSNSLGYVVTYPIPEVISSINAFTLGARFMNPYAEVYVKWVDEASNHEEQCYAIDHQLMDMGIDLICHQESADLATSLNHSGLYFAKNLYADGPIESLATPMWDWGVFYEKIVGNILSGNYTRINGLLGSNDRAISYWWGMDAGVVDVMYSGSKVPKPLAHSVNFMKKMITDGVYHPFTGPIKDQKGKVRVAENGQASNEMIMNMDWFVEGVIGSIPSINASEENHKLYELFSVKKKY